MFSCTTAQHIYCINCSLQLNCTYSNYTEAAAATCSAVEWKRNVMAHAQKPDSVFQRNGGVHLYRRGCLFSRVLAFLECGSGENDCSNTGWTVPSQTEDCLATHSIRIFPLHFSSRASPCATRFRFHSTTAQHIYCTNCTVCNWTVLTVITPKLLLHVQPHNSTAHLLYKLYSLQLNCTYSNYTEAAAATCSAAQQHTSSPADVFWCVVQPAFLNCTCTSTYTFSHVVRSDRTN